MMDLARVVGSASVDLLLADLGGHLWQGIQPRPDRAAARARPDQNSTKVTTTEAPHTFVTTEQFLVAFGMDSPQDLPDPGQMEDAGVRNAT